MQQFDKDVFHHRACLEASYPKIVERHATKGYLHQRVQSQDKDNMCLPYPH